MDVAGTAVGIASLGIQVCQGLLKYYNDWKDQDKIVSRACDSITDLNKTLDLLSVSLKDPTLPPAAATQVKDSLSSCRKGIQELDDELSKLRKWQHPAGAKDKVRAGLQRGLYPFRVGTLMKLRKLVHDVRENLALALQALLLHLGVASQSQLVVIEGHTKDINGKLVAVGTSIGLVRAQGQAIESKIDSVHVQGRAVEGKVDSVHAQGRATGTKLGSILQNQQAENFRKIVQWLSPPDPTYNHNAARGRYQQDTGSWLIESEKYQQWKSSQIPHLWLYGKPGCGKTILCSTVVEDLCTSHANNDAVGFAMFYLSFSDTRKQTYKDLLFSLVSQLCWKKPGLSMLQQTYGRKNLSLPAPDALESFLLASIIAFDRVFVTIDALDECPEDLGMREDLLKGLHRLCSKAPHLKIFAASREF